MSSVMKRKRCMHFDMNLIWAERSRIYLTYLLAVLTLIVTGCEAPRRITLTGEDLGGEAAGEMMAGEMTAGVTTGGELAGEMMTGGMAGEMAGEMVAGEMAGEMVAGPTYQPHETYDLSVDRILSGLSVRRAWPLSSRWLLLTDQGLVIWSPSIEVRNQVGILPQDTELYQGELTPVRFKRDTGYPVPTVAPVTALLVSGQAALLFPDELWVSDGEQEEQWIRSPLSDYFEGARGAAWLDGDLWLSDQEGLAKWSSTEETWNRNPLLERFTGHELSAGPWTSGQALWSQGTVNQSVDEVPEPSSIFAIAEGAKWTHDTWWSDRPIALISSSLTEMHPTVWGVQAGRLIGGIVGTEWGEAIHPLLKVLDVQSVWAGIDELWMIAEQRLWRVGASLLMNESSEGGTLGYASFEGRWWGGQSTELGVLYLWGPDGFLRVLLERTPSWLADQDVLNGTENRFALTGVTLNEETTVKAWLSAEEVTDSSVVIPSEAWTLNHDGLELSLSRDSLPVELAEQSEVWLTALIEQPDRESKIATLRLTVEAPITWSEHIIPIFETACSACHDGPEGARDLSTPELWENDIDVIIFVTEAQSMPIGAPPLSDEEVDLIRLWQLDGFLQ